MFMYSNTKKGEVWQGTWSATQVAIKKLIMHNASTQVLIIMLFIICHLLMLYVLVINLITYVNLECACFRARSCFCS